MEKKKIQKAAELISKNEKLFKCPVCSCSMELKELNSVVCSLNHSFDISRKGYLDLLRSTSKIVYSKELFEARNRVCSEGFYDTLLEVIYNLLNKYKNRFREKRDSLNVLDAGCGEGSHLYRLSHILGDKLSCNLFGFDISKEAINIASNNNSDIIWTVADLTHIPFKDKNFDIILNILSPANYGEFERILKEDGLIIKVIPESMYLGELREAVYQNKSYSNKSVVDYFSDKLTIEEAQNIRYRFPIYKELLPHLIKMTPLTWNERIENEERLKKIDISYITVDLKILTGRKRSI